MYKTYNRTIEELNQPTDTTSLSNRTYNRTIEELKLPIYFPAVVLLLIL